MEARRRGRLEWRGEDPWLLVSTKTGGEHPCKMRLEQISRELTKQDEPIEVEYEGGGSPSRVMTVGQEFQPRDATVEGEANRMPGNPTRPVASEPATLHHPNSGRFHNPYNFVPAPPRATQGALADAPPVAHGRYEPGYWSGRITVTLTTKTPLLIADAAQATEHDAHHKTFPMRQDSDGAPYLAPTAVKGMLRAAYEAVTNSRFGIFSGHDECLTYRAAVSGGRSAKTRYALPPEALLDVSLKPAGTLSELSPADRVFGWSNPAGQGAYRGNLRVGPVTCETPEMLTHFVDRSGQSVSLPLAILSQPKPQQARFYAAADKAGLPPRDGLPKPAGYDAPEQGLRGRKVYPHQCVPEKHWDDPIEDRTQRAVEGWFQEYRRPKEAAPKEKLRNDQGRLVLCAVVNSDGGFAQVNREQRDDQNRSITGWVAPAAVFSFDLEITNLSQAELGALLWLLRLPDDHYHRLGGGKPLGFGSVRLEIVGLDLRDGQATRARYSLDETAAGSRIGSVDNPEFAAATSAFLAAVGTSDGTKCEESSFLRSFLVACRGHRDALPTHYPRSRDPDGRQDDMPVPPSPEGLAYEWFVANEKGPKLALPPLASDQGLPIGGSRNGLQSPRGGGRRGGYRGGGGRHRGR